MKASDSSCTTPSSTDVEETVLESVEEKVEERVVVDVEKVEERVAIVVDVELKSMSNLSEPLLH